MTTFSETSADETLFPLTATSLTLCLPCYLSVRGAKLWRKRKKCAQIEQKILADCARPNIGKLSAVIKTRGMSRNLRLEF